MGLPDELQERILASVVQCKSIILSSELVPGDKQHFVRDTPRSRVPRPTLPFRGIPHLHQMAIQQFYEVNTFRIETRGANQLYDDIRLRPHIRHVELTFRAEAIISLWHYHKCLGETFGLADLDEIRVIEKFPAAFPRLKTMTVKLELTTKDLQLLPRMRGSYTKFTQKIAEKRLEIVTSLLRAVKGLGLAGSMGEIRKYVDLRLAAPGHEPTEIDGRGKTTEELYSEMLGCWNTVARV
jgi:hypothetical protein